MPKAGELLEENNSVYRSWGAVGWVRVDVRVTSKLTFCNHFIPEGNSTSRHSTSSNRPVKVVTIFTPLVSQ